MRLPFPERVPLKIVFWFAAILCAIQLSQKTNPAFALGCFFFILVAGLTFNVAGGFRRPSGAYVFFYAMLTVIVGIVWKAFLGEPADSNLSVPLLTISVYVVGICMMLVSSLCQPQNYDEESHPRENDHRCQYADRHSRLHDHWIPAAHSRFFLAWRKWFSSKRSRTDQSVPPFGDFSRSHQHDPPHRRKEQR